MRYLALSLGASGRAGFTPSRPGHGALSPGKGPTPVMPPNRTCATCNGTGTVQVEITNTATGQTQTITQTCLDCL
jgi:DnaJ-class molecular chaperone